MPRPRCATDCGSSRSPARVLRPRGCLAPRSPASLGPRRRHDSRWRTHTRRPAARLSPWLSHDDRRFSGRVGVSVRDASDCLSRSLLVFGGIGGLPLADLRWRVHFRRTSWPVSPACPRRGGGDLAPRVPGQLRGAHASSQVRKPTWSTGEASRAGSRGHRAACEPPWPFDRLAPTLVLPQLIEFRCWISVPRSKEHGHGRPGVSARVPAKGLVPDPRGCRVTDVARPGDQRPNDLRLAQTTSVVQGLEPGLSSGEPAGDSDPPTTAAEIGIARPAVGSDEFPAPGGSTLP